MKRREFLTAAAVAGAAAATISTRTRRASAIPLFGDVPAEHASLMLPKANQASSILECFLYGGLTPWETFYCVPEFGSAYARTWHQAYPIDFANAALACGYHSNQSQVFTPFASDSTGRLIHLSPFLTPLFARPDLTDRMRIVVNRHDLEVHETAIPLTMTGKYLGSPSLASLGSHVARYFVDHDVDSRHPSPFAYGLSIANSFIPSDNIMVMLASGLHPAAARPQVIKLTDASRFLTLLDRAKVGSGEERARYDALLSMYFQDYQQRLKFAGAGAPLRAPRLAEFAAGTSAVAHASDIQSLLSPEYLVKTPGTACFARGGAQTIGSSTVSTIPLTNIQNYPAMGLKLATHLLTHPTLPARHCMVVDTGLREADGGGGYDTHNETPFTQSHNLYNLLNSLLPLVNAPGETNPNKLDLNKTMIILNMEFGRAPGLQKSTNTGRNHWSRGYVQVYLGGPITTAQKGVYGAIPESGLSTTYTTPAENRIAALLAMGIWPFDGASYSPGHVQGGFNEGIAVQSVLRRVLGYNV